MDNSEPFRGAEQHGAAYGASGRRLRVLVAAHSHPKLSNGGAEISAWQLYQRLAAHDATEAWFLGCDRQRVLARAGAVFTQPFEAREYLYSPDECDWFRFANRDINFPDAFQALLEELLPDVVHFHHYAVLGLEAFAHVKRAVPAAKIVLTLHEYLAICNHYGQMVTRPGRALCYEASPLSCTRCFSDKDASEWFLRKRYIERFFGMVDHFIAPSRFLADRYIDWGVPEANISVVENLVRPHEGQPRKPVQPPAPLRIGFFGQLSWLKGCDVLLDAAELLEDQKEHIGFDIFGDYRSQPEEFQKAFLERLARAGRNVRFHGPYDQRQLDPLMQLVHAV
ncbi:MAG: glycosyltransferase, partial [Acidobacteriaceae bacterium]|nr:glycosyltransferase [Acidobacteriaceae bacterium]